MNTYIKIPKHTDTITQDIVSCYKRNKSFDYSKDIIWKGAKPYNY